MNFYDLQVQPSGEQLIQEESDNCLVQLVAGGDETAFEELVTRHHVKIINLAYHYLHDQQDSEDAAQEIFLKVWKNASKFKSQSAFSTWLYRIAVNTCLNHVRAGKKGSRQVDGDVDLERFSSASCCPTEKNCENVSAISREEREYWVHRAIDTLAPKQKTAIILSRFEGYSYAEIADIMGTSVSAVESHLFRAKQKVAQVLEPLKKKGEI